MEENLETMIGTKHMKKILLLLAVSIVALVSCSNNEDFASNGDNPSNGDNTSDVLYKEMPITIAVSGKAQSRAHWTDNNDKTASFVWDENSDVVTLVKHGESYVKFYDESEKESFCSMTSVTPKTDDATQAQLTTTSKLKLTASGTEPNITYDIPVSVNDPVYCFSPVNAANGSVVNATASAATITANMPAVFTQSATGKLEEFKDYSYIYTNTNLVQTDENAITAEGTEFKTAAAVLRFCLTDNTDTDIKLSSIKMEAEDGSKIFPNQLIWTAGNATPIEEPTDKENYYSCIQVNTGGTDGATIAKNGTGTYYMYVLPSANAYTGKKLTFTVETNYLTYSFTLSASKITNSKFEAGKLYTFNMNLNEKSIELSTIEIASCETYDVSTEKTSVEVIESVNQWSQESVIAQNISFVDLGIRKMVNGTQYKVLWATANLGSKVSTAPGQYYQWGALQPYMSSTDNGYYTADEDIQGGSRDMVLNKYGDSNYKWCLPSANDWQVLVQSCAQTYAAIKTDDFDQSMWRFRRNDNATLGADMTAAGYSLLTEGYATQRIYFPITGFYNSNGFQNLTVCHYWTSTPVAGGTQAVSYSTTRIEGCWTVDTDGNKIWHEGTNDPFASENADRSLGYAIRPILFLEDK